MELLCKEETEESGIFVAGMLNEAIADYSQHSDANLFLDDFDPMQDPQTDHQTLQWLCRFLFYQRTMNLAWSEIHESSKPLMVKDLVSSDPSISDPSTLIATIRQNLDILQSPLCADIKFVGDFTNHILENRFGKTNYVN